MRATGRGEKCWSVVGLWYDCGWTRTVLMSDKCWIVGYDGVGKRRSDDTG